jgi:signal transduction histidine kinase
MALHEILASRLELVLQHWKRLVSGTLAPEAMPPLELIDHLPEFLEETVDALTTASGHRIPPSTPAHRKTAAIHGAQRLRLGFSLDSVVREYGAICDAILATADEAGAAITRKEMQVIFHSMISGIAHAVSEYARQRDAELSRQANEHFAFIAHELRNPLSSAVLAFQQLEAKGHLPAAERSVGALARGLRRANALVDETLQAARIASGVELRRRWTAIQPIFEDAELATLAEADAKGIELRVTLERDELVYVDVRLVESAITNLLRNGVKYTHAGGIVELRGTIANGRVVVEIEDRCGGLEPGKVESAFAPFVRLDERESGFGLGLAIAKQAAEAHGGTIRVQNLPGTGCIFVLDLPLQTNLG